MLSDLPYDGGGHPDAREVRPWAHLGSPRPLMQAEREVLFDCRFQSRSVAASQTQIVQSSLADTLFFLERGWACQFKSTLGGRRQILRILTAGDFLNVEGVIFGRNGSAVLHLAEGQVSSTPAGPVRALMARHADIARRFAWIAARDATISQQTLFCLGRLNANQRLAHLLCEMAVRLGHHQASGHLVFEFPLTQEVLADVLGLTAVHVNRTMQWLRAERLISTSDRVVTVNDIGNLRRLCEFDPAYLHTDYEP